MRCGEWRDSLARAIREAFRSGVRGPAWEGCLFAQPWSLSLDRIDAHVAGAEIDELSLQLLLVIAQHPLRIPFEAETPERLLAPQLV